jgi:hypothetical protein
MEPLADLVAPAPAASPRVAAPALAPGAVIGRSFAIWWRYLPAFALVALVFDLPVLAIEAAAGPIEPDHPSFQLETFLSTVLWSGIQPALTYGTLRALAGERVRVGAMLRVGLTKLFPVFLVSLGSGLAMFLGAVAFVIPGIVAACALWLAVPAVVAEPVGPSSAMRRSIALTKGNRMRILAVGATLVLAFLGAILATGAASWAGEGVVPPRVEALLVEVLATLVLALFPVAATVAYDDLRRAKEGVPATELERVFG